MRLAHHVVLEGVVAVEPVHGRGASATLQRHVEPGVNHAQRLQDSFVEHLMERFSFDPRSQHADHIGGVAVGQSFTRLMHQR